MAEERFFGVDRHALLASHIAFADPACSCSACRLRRGEIQIVPRRRCPGKSLLGPMLEAYGLARHVTPPAAVNDNE